MSAVLTSSCVFLAESNPAVLDSGIECTSWIHFFFLMQSDHETQNSPETVQKILFFISKCQDEKAPRGVVIRIEKEEIKEEKRDTL